MRKEHLLPFNPIAIAKRAQGSGQALRVLQAKGQWARQQRLLANMHNSGLDPAGTF